MRLRSILGPRSLLAALLLTAAWPSAAIAVENEFEPAVPGERVTVQVEPVVLPPGTTSVNLGEVTADVSYLRDIEVLPLGFVLRALGETQQVFVYGWLFPDARRRMGKGLSFHSEDASVATISRDGVVTARGEGITKIWVRYKTKSAAIIAIVRIGSKVEGISFFPDNYEFKSIARVKQFTLHAYDGRGSSEVSFSSMTRYWVEPSSVAVATDHDRVVAVGAGRAVLYGSYAGMTTEASIDVVISTPIRSLRLEPSQIKLRHPGDSAQLSATATLQDGRNLDLTRHESGILYGTSNPAVAIVDSDGRVRARKDGRAEIVARYSESHIRIPVYVTSSRLERLRISPPGGTVAISEKNPVIEKYLRVYGWYSDETEENLTLGTTGTVYETSKPELVTITRDGRVLINGVGRFTITARNGKVSVIGNYESVRDE